MSHTEDDHLRRAAQSTFDKLDQLQQDASDTMLRLLTELRQNLFAPGYKMTELQEAIGASRWITATFRAAVGLTPWRFLQEARLLTAATLLRDTSISVEEIALLVGYEYLFTFQRAFEGWCGLSPSVFRAYAQKVRQELIRLPDDVLSWAYQQRFERGELTEEELGVLLRHLEEIYEMPNVPRED